MNDGQQIEIDRLKRTEARSGQLSYSEPIAIHETTKSRIILVPFYIKRSSGIELAIKLVSYKKIKTGTFFEWQEQDKTISLTDGASRTLIKALKEYFALGEHEEDGDYIAIKVTNGVADVAGLAPNVVADAVASLLNSKEIIKHLASKELGQELVAALKSAIRLQELRSAVVQLRHYLDSGIKAERVYQQWCEKHSWAFGNAYVMRDSVRQRLSHFQLKFAIPVLVRI